MSASEYREIEAYVRAYPVPYQIAQWTFAASRRHPALAVVLRRIVWCVGQITDSQLTEWSKSMRFTLQLTGPVMFTQVCNEFLSGTRDGALRVLPRLAWGSWLFEHERPELAGRIKVKHLFEGSWISDKNSLPKNRDGSARPPAVDAR